MKFECVRAESCYAAARTYDYRLPVTAAEFRFLLEGWDVSENRKYRRPMFTAEREGVRLQGVLTGAVVRVSFPDGEWETKKNNFERWLTAVEEKR